MKDRDGRLVGAITVGDMVQVTQHCSCNASAVITVLPIHP